MRPLLRVFCSVLAAASLGACATNERLPEARYTMVERQVLPLDQRVAITYEGADDSRCPENARCMWAGQVAYRFTLRIGNSVAQAFYLVPGRPGYTNPALRGSRIELDRNLTAPPRGVAEMRPASYPVTFNMYAM
ncbi:hypothetical protein [Massilia sp. ST3]|uniref:hypothetical protein n=1 Tax=Massilia sp. ST3 TaxID=2824903 RepID=UPI001B81759E|nr:hypothetical protein [Massilia sp. ST3]MBQ5950202.1 hypothetical protein [Massilia sp. ST3]